MNGRPPRQERGPFLKKVDSVALSMRWLGLVLCLLWLGWRLQALWQWSQRQWRLDPLSNEFQQELRRRGLVGGFALKAKRWRQGAALLSECGRQ